MIEVRNLTKRYGDHEAVGDLSFQVPKGQVCGFLGPNGAGKSTTLRMLTGFLSPTHGSITIGGVDAREEPVEARKLIGYMPELCPLYPEMRVDEYLRYRAELKGVARADRDAYVEKALENAAVKDVSTRIIGQLSKGYRQRVGLADALVADPPLLVLDEPTAGLDPNQIRQVRELIGRLAKNKTVILSTHILPEVEAICDRVLILHRGKLVSEGEPSALRGVSSHQTISLTARAEPSALAEALDGLDGLRVAGIRKKKGVAPDPERAPVVTATIEAEGDPDAVERVFAAVAEAGIVLRELRHKHASLEDVFADLTTSEPTAEPTLGEEEE